MDLAFTVLHVNEGPAPFDVTATTAGVECRLRFDDAPGLAAGDTLVVSYEPRPQAEPATD